MTSPVSRGFHRLSRPLLEWTFSIRLAGATLRSSTRPGGSGVVPPWAILRHRQRSGAVGPVPETLVYLRGPGTVVRCRGCTSVLMVIALVRGLYCVDLDGLAALQVNPRQ